MWAAAENHVDVTKVLLEVGADIDARSKALDTPQAELPAKRRAEHTVPPGRVDGGDVRARQGAADTTRVLAERAQTSTSRIPMGRRR